MAISSLLVPGVSIPKTDHSWLSSVFDSIDGAMQRTRENASYKALADRIGVSAPSAPSSPAPPTSTASSFGTAPITPVDRGKAQGSTYEPFISTVRSKVTNPYALAAVAATGRAESGWSAGNANRTWSDPSQSGQAGMAGGVMSWRGPRLASLQNYAKSKGEQGNGSPQTQAEFFLQENPQLIDQLNKAGSPQEAADIMANAWRFAGYDQQGGEAARRRALAQNYYAQEFGRGGNAASAAIDAVAPPSGSVGGFDAGRFASGPVQSEATLPAALAASNAQTPYVDPTVSVRPQAAPQQVADASGIIAPGVTPVQRGGVDPSIIQFMLRDPNLREVGLKLWAANAGQQRPNEPWQFVTLPDGTLARANQQTGAIERVGQFSKPEKPEEPKIVELFDDATGQPYKAQWNPQTRTYDRVGGVKARSGMQLTTNPDGTVTLTEGAIGNMPKLSEAEGRNAGFYGRGVESHNVLNTLEDQGTSLWNKTAGNVPIVGNFLRSEDAQKYDQAKRNFINAVLRRESGAVIADEEFANADQQYFPQPGDGPEVIAQKRRNREVTIQGLKVSSGQGANFAIPPQDSRQTGTPAAGAVEDGYRFRGGDPADPKNWEKVR